MKLGKLGRFSLRHGLRLPESPSAGTEWPKVELPAPQMSHYPVVHRLEQSFSSSAPSSNKG